MLTGRRRRGTGSFVVSGYGVGGAHNQQCRALCEPSGVAEGQEPPALGRLACCGYCLGHWVAFGLVAIYRPRLLEVRWLLDYSLAALV